MKNEYYDTIDQLEKDGVSRDYVLGWVSGYLGNPEIEEQRMTDAWQAGYTDGGSKTTENAVSWKS